MTGTAGGGPAATRRTTVHGFARTVVVTTSAGAEAGPSVV